MNICVFGASSNDIDNEYIKVGEELGRLMSQNGHVLVFGGGTTGMMGAVARGIESECGNSIGIAPSFFDRPGILHKNCSEFYFTETMRERKELMEEKSDAFIMTPGGIGTLEEFFEIFTLRQLARHSKPIGILNIKGYYDEMVQMLKHISEQGFVDEGLLNVLKISENPRDLLLMMERDGFRNQG